MNRKPAGKLNGENTGPAALRDIEEERRRVVEENEAYAKNVRQLQDTRQA